MRTLRYVLRNINVINIILAGMLVFLMGTMGSSGEDIRIKPPEEKKPVAQEAAPAVKTEERQNPFPTDYSIIAEQNLFHPDRKIPVETVAAAPLPTPDFVLYGTLISEDLNVAYMEDKKAPQSTPGRANRQSALHQGESLSGYVVKEINKDKVIMARGDETVVVNLDDPAAKKRTAAAQQPGQPQGQAGRGQVSNQAVRTQPNTTRTRRTSQPSRLFVPSEQRTSQPASSNAGPSSGAEGSRANFLDILRRGR